MIRFITFLRGVIKLLIATACAFFIIKTANFDFMKEFKVPEILPLGWSWALGIGCYCLTRGIDDAAKGLFTDCEKDIEDTRPKTEYKGNIVKQEEPTRLTWQQKALLKEIWRERDFYEHSQTHKYWDNKK